MLSGVVTYDYTPGTPVVPEPSTWAMMLIGFACLGLRGASAQGRRSRNLRLGSGPVLAEKNHNGTEGFHPQARRPARRRVDRWPAKPSPANPTSIIAQVDGSGTAPPMARSKPNPPGPSAMSV
jgi:hypothetical protein